MIYPIIIPKFHTVKKYGRNACFIAEVKHRRPLPRRSIEQSPRVHCSMLEFQAHCGQTIPDILCPPMLLSLCVHMTRGWWGVVLVPHIIYGPNKVSVNFYWILHHLCLAMWFCLLWWTIHSLHSRLFWEAFPNCIVNSMWNINHATIKIYVRLKLSYVAWPQTLPRPRCSK